MAFEGGLAAEGDLDLGGTDHAVAPEGVGLGRGLGHHLVDQGEQAVLAVADHEGHRVLVDGRHRFALHADVFDEATAEAGQVAVDRLGVVVPHVVAQAPRQGEQLPA